MTESKRKNDKIACPETHYLSPNDIAKDYSRMKKEEVHSARGNKMLGNFCPRAMRVCQEVKKVLIRVIVIG
jgi:hypothetical protein